MGQFLKLLMGGDVGIAEKEKTEGSDLLVYPNPATAQVTIKINLIGNKNVSIKLKNVLGQTVQKINQRPLVGQNRIEIDINELPKGLYFVQLQTENRLYSQKIIKQ
jgi:hypothetical protein